MYVFEFKTKIAGLDINLALNASEKYVEGIACYKNISVKQLYYERNMTPLSQNDCNRLEHLYKLINLLDNYFSNKIVDFHKIPINFASYSGFSKKILKTLRGVKYGKTLSYKELALKAGFSEKYSRACATALSINKTPIVIPCHRIITADGKLGGYSGCGGTEFKTALLTLEQNNL